jgi:hypothetical protein
VVEVQNSLGQWQSIEESLAGIVMAQRFKILTDEHIAKAVVTQLRKNSVFVEHVEDTIGKGTLDPDILEYAHTHGFTLLTHDERIVSHISARLDAGNDHSGIFVALNICEVLKELAILWKKLLFGMLPLKGVQPPSKMTCIIKSNISANKVLQWHFN